MTSDRPGLDATVESLAAQLEDRRVPAPSTLLMLSTGVGLLPERTTGTVQVAFDDLRGVPAPWDGATLTAGDLGPLAVWIVDDLSGDALDDGGPPWRRALPIWLAAVAGAETLVHVTAGVALGTGAAPRAEGLGLAADHINLSGRTPLTGLGTTTLGPLFPDQSTLHDGVLRHRALELASENGITAAEVVVACTTGPSLDTAAECRFYARAGADVAVQGAAWPYVAAAHAGLSTLGVVALCASVEERLDLRRILERAEKAAPAIEELIVKLAPTLASFADESAGSARPLGS